jgi:hypothetical protein
MFRPTIPMGSMVMNMAANMLALPTPPPAWTACDADIERLNRRPGVATNAMCTFLAINTSSIQLIPATTVGILAAGATSPTSIIGTAFAATVCSTVAGIVAVKSLEKLPGFALPKIEAAAKKLETATEESTSTEGEMTPLSPGWRVLLLLALSFFGTLFVMMAFFPGAFETLANSVRSLLSVSSSFAFSPDWIGRHWLARTVETLSLLAIPFILTMFPLYAAAKRIPVYEEFVEGAKEGFQVAIRIIPFLVAILVAVGCFAQLAESTARPPPLPDFRALRFPAELLPLVLMRPSAEVAQTAFSRVGAEPRPRQLDCQNGRNRHGQHRDDLLRDRGVFRISCNSANASRGRGRSDRRPDGRDCFGRYLQPCL